MTDLVAELRALRDRAYERLLDNQDFRIVLALDKALAEIASDVPMHSAIPGQGPAHPGVAGGIAAPSHGGDTADVAMAEFMPEIETEMEAAAPAEPPPLEPVAPAPGATADDAGPGDADNPGTNHRLAELAAGLSAIGAAIEDGIATSEEDEGGLEETGVAIAPPAPVAPDEEAAPATAMEAVAQQAISAAMADGRVLTAVADRLDATEPMAGQEPAGDVFRDDADTVIDVFKAADANAPATAGAAPIERVEPRSDAYEAALNRLNGLIDRASKQLRSTGSE